MQIPREAISNAIEGGWKPEPPKYTRSQKFPRTSPDGVNLQGKQWQVTVYQIALDPTFWSCLGKALGWDKEPASTKTGEEWGERFCHHCGISTEYQPSRESGCNHAHYPEACKVCRKNPHEWKVIIHRFYDLILTGDDTEKFWKDLLE